MCQPLADTDVAASNAAAAAGSRGAVIEFSAARVSPNRSQRKYDLPDAAFVSPFRAERRLARDLVGEGEFVEVYVDVPPDVAEARDTTGLFASARRGDLRNVTGFDAPYEAPEHPELRIDGTTTSAEAAADAILEHLRAAGVVGG